MLDYLFNPRGIAVIGASADKRKVGGAVLANLRRHGYRGGIHPVNTKGGMIDGMAVHRSVGEIHDAVDIAVVAVPAAAVPQVLIDCGGKGVGAAVILSAGFRETGREGRLLEQRIAHIARSEEIRLVGPNCLGVISTESGMNASFAGTMPPSGRVSFISQSGALGIAILDWAIGNGVGLSKFVSLGNKADLSEIEFIEYFADDPGTDVVLAYLEDVTDGRRFIDVVRRATRRKPVVILKSGGTAAGARAASSHTGALAGSDAAFDAAFRQAGVIRADGVSALFDAAAAFTARKLPEGDRLLVVTNAGGPGILAADTADRIGLQLPFLGKASLEALSAVLPSNASLYNPVDIIGDAPPERYRAVIDTAMADPAVDGVLVVLTPQAMTAPDTVARVVADAAEKGGKTVLASFMGDVSVHHANELLRSRGVPAFPFPETAVRAYKRLCDYRDWQRSADDLPEHVEGDAAGAAAAVRQAIGRHVYEVGEETAGAILSCYGFTFPRRGLAHSAADAARIAEDIGFPVVMKIASPDILHKTDVGGVRVSIASAAETAAAFTEITTNAQRLMPDAFIQGVAIYEMAQPGREVILGMTRDHTFGPLIMFGLGGIYVEVLKDVSFRVAPVSRREALAMIDEVRSAALLKGARGERPADIAAVAGCIVRLSQLVLDIPEIQELDINPLVAYERGTLALDARMAFKRP